MLNEHLQQLEALRRHPALQVAAEQRPAIVREIVHDVMHPYFQKISRWLEAKYGNDQCGVQVHAIAKYCLREYVDSPEHLTVAFIKGLHRQLFLGLTRVPLKTPDGAEAFMVPGEFKSLPAGISRRSNPQAFFVTASPERVARDMEMLLDMLHDDSAPLLQRYFRFMLDLTSIHPFPDGNGRLAILLGDMFLLKRGMTPLYFARYKWANEWEFYELAERYSNDPARDISIFYPLAVRGYERLAGAAGKIHSARKNIDWPQFQQVIKVTLLPKLLSKFQKDEKTNRALVGSFEQHTADLAKFCADYFMGHVCLSTQFISDLHRLLYPPGFFIRSVRYGVPVDTWPGEWRTQVLLVDDYGCTSFSSPPNIASDFAALLEAFCDSSKMTRERLLAFCIDFLHVHPFADSNGTISAMLCDIECFRYDLRPLNMQHLRAKDKPLLFQLARQYGSDRTDATLGQALMAIDRFHHNFGFSHPPALFDDLTKEASITKFFQQVGFSANPE